MKKALWILLALAFIGCGPAEDSDGGLGGDGREDRIDVSSYDGDVLVTIDGEPLLPNRFEWRGNPNTSKAKTEVHLPELSESYRGRKFKRVTLVVMKKTKKQSCVGVSDPEVKYELLRRNKNRSAGIKTLKLEHEKPIRIRPRTYDYFLRVVFGNKTRCRLIEAQAAIVGSY